MDGRGGLHGGHRGRGLSGRRRCRGGRGGVRAAGSDALCTPFGAAFADRFPRDRVLALSCLIRAVASVAVASVLAAGGPHLAVYALAVISTAAFRLFRPTHSAILPGLCNTPFELSTANVVRGLLDSVSTLLGPLAAALLLYIDSPAAVFAISAALSLTSGALLFRLSY